MNLNLPSPLRDSTSSLWLRPRALPLVWKSTLPLSRSLSAKVFNNFLDSTPVIDA